jgi:hypothetical protein
VERGEPKYAPAVYGSIVATAIVGSTFEHHATPRTMTLTLASTMAVFFLAHLWSEIVGERAAEGAAFRRDRVLELAREEWPMIEAGAIPVALVAFAWIGVYSRDLGAELALTAGILQLVGWGIVVGRRTFKRWSLALLSGIVDGLLGLAIVGLEIAIH